MSESDNVPPKADPTLKITESISILMEEYKSLRAEILQRNTVLNNFLTVSVVATVSLFVYMWKENFLIAVLLLIVLANVIFVVFKCVEFDTLAAAARVREIEGHVNSKAKERLLLWETDHGLYTVGYGDRGQHIKQGYAEIMQWLKSLAGRSGS
jgi:hypothetical protein